MVKSDLFPKEATPVSHFKVRRHKAGSSRFYMELYRDNIPTGIHVIATPYMLHLLDKSDISSDERQMAILSAGKLFKEA